MCTVSFIARRRGYLLAMNRDENLTREKGLPPKMMLRDVRKIIFPTEPGGGTWIALNDGGVTFALINWYSISARVKVNAVSRGVVVNSVSAQVSPLVAAEILTALPLLRMNPFRLIGVFPATQEIFEWRWDLKKLACKKYSRHSQQWISSGFDEPTAQRVRSATFRRALQQKSVGTVDWLRRLHRSHPPACGPFSTCMHRADAATVSCTEVAVSSRAVRMSHHATAPCKQSSRFIKAFALAS